MKILIITLHYLDQNSGGSFASRAFINAFANIADSSILLYPDRGISIREYIDSTCELKGIVDKRSKLKRGIDIYRGIIHRFNSNIVLTEIDLFNPDIVVFDNSRCSAGLIEKLKRRKKKIITIHHNFELEYYKGTKPNIVWRIPFMHYMKKAERRALINSDVNLTLTEQDSTLLLKYYSNGKKININYLGCFEYKTIKSEELIKPKNKIIKIVITGNLSAIQTELCLVDFLENIFPDMEKKLRDFELIIAGRNPSNSIKKLCEDNSSIKLIENPLNMSYVIQNADIYLCPIFLGGGLKLRIMDGLKLGLPVLSHEISARGYDKFIESNCLFVYNSNSSFIVSLEKILLLINQEKMDNTKIQGIYNVLFSFEAGVFRLKKIFKDNNINYPLKNNE